MASVSAPASELSVQLPALASTLAVPPLPASTAEPVDLSAAVTILEDPGSAADAAAPAAPAAAAASTRAGFLPDSRCLLIFIYRGLCSGLNVNTSILEVVALHLLIVSFSPCCVCHMHRFFMLSSLPLVFCSSCLSAFCSYFAGISCALLVGTWVQILPCTRCCFCCSLHMSVWPVLLCGTGWM